MQVSIGAKYGSYKVLGLLGKGGMGDVYRARDTQLQRDVALKFLPEPYISDSECLARFRREAQVLASLNHPNIAQIYSLEGTGAVRCIVMELVEGETLEEKLRLGPIPVDEALDIAKQITEALEAAHAKGIIHRDLKPANIKIRQDGKVKVLDFGIAKVIQSETSARTSITGPLGGVIGTVAFMSPEQALGMRLDVRSDIFSFGVVCYQMCTGVLPFLGASNIEIINAIVNLNPVSPAQLNPSITDAVQNVILKCLEKQADKRYQTAAEIFAALNDPEHRPQSSFRHPTNLPHYISTFIGRHREIANLKRILSEARLVTIAGAGGSGKTRFSVQLAAEIIENYPDGIWFLDLGRIVDPAVLLQTLSSTIRIPEQAGSSLLSVVLHHLESRQTLLLLDGCEHLLTACSDLVKTLLENCPQLRILITSRQPLEIAGERVWRIPSLSLPELSGPLRLDVVAESEAVRLFRDRASAIEPDFILSDENAGIVARICCELDGIPLAIELAAARTKILSVHEIQRRLTDRLRFLVSGSKTTLSRQQTLRASLDWSYNLLTAEEKLLFGRLAIFSGGWTLEAAEVVCCRDGLAREDILDALGGLTDKSLITKQQVQTGIRFRFQEATRQYAQEHLAASGYSQSARRNHARYFANLAERVSSEFHGPNQQHWLNSIEADHDNMRGALFWSKENDPRCGLELAGALTGFWLRRGYFEEGRNHLRELLACSVADNALRARGLIGAAALAERQADYAYAKTVCEEAGGLYALAGDKRGLGLVATILGSISYKVSDHERAQQEFQQARDLFMEAGDVWRVATSLVNLGNVAIELGKFDSGCDYYMESLKTLREVGDQLMIGTVLVNLGDLYLHLGELKDARFRLEEGLKIRQSLGDKYGMAVALFQLARVSLREEDLSSASSCVQHALIVTGQVGAVDRTAQLLRLLSSISALEGERERAVWLFAAAENIRSKIGIPSRISGDEPLDLDSIRSAIGESRFQELSTAAKIATLDEAINFALQKRRAA